MAKTAPRTILLKGRGHRLERQAGGAVMPGHLVMLNSSDQLVVHNVAKGRAQRAFAVEAEHLAAGATTYGGGDIDTPYAAGDYLQAEILYEGCEVNALVAASAAALVIGDQVESAGDGTVRKLTPDNTTGPVFGGYAIGVVLAAVDNSANGASTARVRISLF